MISTNNQTMCLQKIIHKLTQKPEIWPNGNFDSINYHLSGYPGDNLEKKYLYAKKVYEECLIGYQVSQLEVIAKFDEMLGLTGKRRHFNHSFEVFLLGLLIMNHKRNLFAKVWKEHGVTDKKVAWRKNFFTWLFTASFHDFGYPLEQSSKIIETIADMYFGIDVARVSDKFKMINTEKFLITEDYLYKYYSLKNPSTLLGAKKYEMDVYDLEEILKNSFAMSLDEDSAEEYQQNKAKDKHGFVGALLLARQTMGVTMDDSKDFNLESLMMAIGAVMVHSLPSKTEEKVSKDPYQGLVYSVNPKKNVFAYLLTLLDGLQDWDRNYGDSSDKYPEYTLNSFDFTGDTIALSFLVHCFTSESIDPSIKFIADKKALGKISKNFFNLKVRLEY